MNKLVQAAYNIVYTKDYKIKSKIFTNLTRKESNSIMTLVKGGI